MPFARNWLEELVIEWLQLDGFLVESNLPVAVAQAGGRLEADVVGAKIYNNVMEVRHIETGTLAGGDKSVKSVQKKFSDVVKASIEMYFKNKFSFAHTKINYEKLYVASYSTKPVETKLESHGIKVIRLMDFIFLHVFPTVQRWKDNPPHQPRTRGSYITFPEAHWLLQMLDFVNSHGALQLTINETEAAEQQH